MKRLGPDDASMKDARASSIIMGLCGQSALAHILIIEGAYEQWTKLKNIYAPLGPDHLDAKMMVYELPRTRGSYDSSDSNEA